MPTLVELKTFYDSEHYQNMLYEFATRSNREFDHREFDDMFRLYFKLTYCQRRYVILNVPFFDVLSVISSHRDKFLNYQIAATEFFQIQEIDTTYLIERFCEFYLLHTGDYSRLLSYLFIVKPSISFRPRQYADKITTLYRQIRYANVNQRARIIKNPK